MFTGPFITLAFNMSLNLRHTATARLARCQSEKYPILSRKLLKAGLAWAVYATTFLTSGSSGLTGTHSRINGSGVADQRKVGHFHQSVAPSSSLALVPRETMSAGFFLVSTKFHALTFVQFMICWTRFETKMLNLLDSLFM